MKQISSPDDYASQSARSSKSSGSIHTGLDHERLQELVDHGIMTPQEAEAQKQLKHKLEQRRLKKISDRMGVDLTLDDLTIFDIITFRRGPFSTPPFPCPKVEVRNITHLDIAVMPFWPHEAPKATPEGSGPAIMITVGKELVSF